MSAFSVILLLIYTAIILIALGGNLLVCFAILCDRNLRRQQENLFLVSLAVSDLLVSTLVMSFAAANDTLDYWPFGRLCCQVWICCDITCTTASILNLSAIAMHRFLHISRPLVYVRRRKIRVAIIIVWLISASIGFSQIIFELAQRNENNGQSEFHESSTNNAKRTCELRLKPLYALGSSMCSFFIPATMMVLLYTRLYLYARKHAKIIRSQLQQAASYVIAPIADEHIHKSSGFCDANAGLERDGTSSLRCCCFQKRSMIPVRTPFDQHNITDQKARLTLGVIMGTFLICWLPFFIVNVIRSFLPGSISDAQFEQKAHFLFSFTFCSIRYIMPEAVTWLGYANSTVNPIIYTILNKDFRTAFKKILFDNMLCSSRDTLLQESCGHNRKRINANTLADSMPCTNINSRSDQQMSPTILGMRTPRNNDLVRCSSTPIILTCQCICLILLF